ncbi:beta-ketoacyl synthase chain length factor [Taibaiella lutea]|uniref:Beta-ketoacyl synthase chain length factor n=1 Tax=Taibaiella lutea TaxID=2608001 RepID=A0A5M6CNB8_9BACT|nr:beta-ketoacyl synthase chain length factor [Taibaiella lutea]KAA5536557.1 beta-ketoacyl synthase chain length factor [Taibaiella lutea]
MYINSFCSITSAGIINQYSATKELQPLKAAKVLIVEPDYKDLIAPMQLRRMSKPIRTGVAAAKLCMQSHHNFMPASIHVGTAYGMLDDSEIFLKKMLEQEEQMLNPTAFIQSTHNTVSGQIALSIGCTAHNMTFVHNAHSFENALLDAALFLNDMDDDGNILIGAVEECTDTSYEIMKRFDVYSSTTAAGEGATFFALSKNKKTESIAKISAFEIFKAKDATMLEITLNNLTEKHEAAAGDLFIGGTDASLSQSIFNSAETYQQYSGKYATMSAFGLAYACLKLKESDKEKCWLLNQSGNYYSLISLSKI